MSHVGVYLCPRGAYVAECRFRGGGVEIARTHAVPAHLVAAEQAASHLLNVLAAAGLRRARVAVTMRGFDIGHHVLSLPPAKEGLLGPIIDREVRRLEPHLEDPVIGWLPLPPEPATPEAPSQLHILAAAAPRTVVEVLERALRSAGHTLTHLTAIPAAVQRLQEEFDGEGSTGALVLPLPDGAFLGFFLWRALRLAVEPPLQEQEAPDASSLAEELELGAMFVRQQFRGAQVERVTVAAPASVIPDADEAIAHKMGVPTSRLDVHGLGTAELAALGAVLDSRAAQPLSLGGSVGATRRTAARGALQTAAVLAVAATFLVGGWTVYQAVAARRAAAELLDARRRVEQESFGIRPLRETADRRKLIRDAVTALRLTAGDRLELVRLLGGVAGAVVDPVSLDSLHLDRGSDGWVAAMAGRVTAPTNGRAVQALHEFYRDLPARLSVEQLTLEQLTYADSAGLGIVRFQLSFVLPSPTESGGKD